MSNLQTRQVTRFKKPEVNPMLYGKLPPQAIELEQVVLGAMMVNSEIIDEVSSIIPTGDCFYLDANQRIYKSIISMYHAGARIDFMTVCEKLKQSGDLEIIGGSYYVIGLTNQIVSTAHTTEHSRIVMEKYLMRELIRVSGELLSQAYEEGSDVFELLQTAESSFTKLAEDNIQTPYLPIAHNAGNDLEEIAEHMLRIKEQGQVLTGVPTGFPTINRITNGWQKGDLIILAARPSVGKTAFALNLALGAGEPIGFFSLEMSLESLRKRLTAIQTGVPLTNITSCRLDDIQFNQISGNLSRLNNTPLYVDDSSTLTVFDIKAKARRMKKREGVKMIIIDYLQLITAPNDRMIREQQIAQVSRELKKLAKELQIPVIALSQLSRDIEKRKGEPVLSDLRESGSIEQDADLVSFLYRHDDNIRWRLAKHRNGKLDFIDFNANLDIQKFSELGTDFPEKATIGFKPTENSGRLIPIAEAKAKFEDEDDLPF
jgi:replicative DNA helicase